MKNFTKVISVVLLVTVINACTLQEVPDPTTTGAITITAQTVQEQGATNVPETKTTTELVAVGEGYELQTHWVAGVDEIGIFSPEAKPGPAEEDYPPTNNAEFTAQASGMSSDFTGTMFWGADVEHHFYAYYPYKSTYTGNQTEVPISLPPAQTQSAANNMDHIGALDFMVATPDTVARYEPVNLTFNHVFAMIEFQIKGSGTLTQISFNGASPLACEGTVDLTSKPLPLEEDTTNPYVITTESTSNVVSVTCGPSGFTLSGTAISVYMMILPGEQSENLQIAFKIGDDWQEMSKPAPEGGFVRGKKYTVSLNSDSEIAGWKPAIQDSRDGNIYQYVTIGSQIWMAENLAYLPSVVDPATGSEDAGHETECYYYVYDYNGTNVAAAKATANYTSYGVLYNWTATLAGASSSSANPSGVQGICPDGWHLPSDAEWTILTTYLEGESVAGGKMKETGTTHWTSPNTGATNESGFTALPGGTRYNNGTFGIIGYNGTWWSSTESGTSTAWSRKLYYDYSYVGRYGSLKGSGYSVRCLRN
jgi:uncharacterized protein (TIGR02145 family)